MQRTRFEIAAEFRLCRREDLPALAWMGLHGREREVIAAAFAARQQGRGAMLLALAGGFPIGQARIDFAGRGAPARPVIWPAGHLAGRSSGPCASSRRCRARGSARRSSRRPKGWRPSAARRGVELTVERQNGEARRFCRRLGYGPADARRERVRYGGDTAEEVLELVIMRKRLPAPRLSARVAPPLAERPRCDVPHGWRRA